jgi:rare lipoprotein A (peptidoglycan hydrolase)
MTRPRDEHRRDDESPRPGASRRFGRRGRRRLTRRRAGAVALLCTLSTLWIAAVATARPPTPPAVLGSADFHAVVLPATNTVTPAPILDFVAPQRSFTARPTPVQSNTAKTALKVPPHPRLTGKRVSGSATWYCQTGASACHAAYTGGMYAAAGPALRVGAWRGRVVQVCGGGRCVWVTLIDWCACGGTHVIDLYGDAFRQLATLSSGALKVTVRW